MTMKTLSAILMAGVVVVSCFSAESVLDTNKFSSPVHLTAEQDHKRMMELLGIVSLRPGADPNRPDAPNAVNYDEAKANPYPKLPDPLVLKNGERVTSAEVWWKRRRPEIVEDFDREIYGRVPTNVPPVRWELTSTTKTNIGDAPVITKQLVGHVDNSSYPLINVEIQLTLTTPANARGPVPVMMHFGFGATNRFRGESRWQQQLLAKGWGYAILVPTSIQADNGAGLTRGIIGLCNKGQPRRPDDWGALRAWAWGASRALDYLETDKAVDATQVGIEGLSRYGKAALVAMAYDPRFAIGFIGSSGEGGAKLHRRAFGELVENLAGSGAYHWMAGNFLKYGGPLNAGDLPVDAHELIALCAPRPVFISYGASDGPGAEGQWVDQRGSFMAAVAAGPVYRLLGKKDLGTTEFPAVETALIEGELAWRQHSGGHTTGPNWPVFLQWADRYIKTPVAAQQAPVRVIHADLKQIKGPRSMAWQDCVGAGRVAEGLRDGWRRQLEDCRREIGFKYLRMHGLLQDELGVYSEDANGRPRYNWQYIDDVYDFLLSIGIKPFVEFGFMPKTLASGSGTIFWWNGNVTPPKDYAKWDALIAALVKHWTDRYGEDEVRTWRFEVWNEPNLRLFWQPQTDPMTAYFELYEHTARAVHSVSTNYLVGGPAGAGPVWTRELIEFCHTNRLPLDFISFHSYGLGGGPSGLDQYGNEKLYLAADIHFVAHTVNSQFPIIRQSPKPGLPVHITEWSASYSPRDPVHDSYFEAAFILEQLRRTEAAASMSYWTFTDIFEENGPVPRPFHGGFGLINFQGIRKPAFWAYKFLAMLGETELQNADASSYVCVDKTGGVQVLLWDIAHPTDGKVSNQDFFFRPHPAREKGPVAVRLRNLSPGKYRLRVYQIGYRQNDPYSRYLEMGSPTDLSRADAAELRSLSTGRPVSETTVTVGSEGVFEQTLAQRENDVYLLSLQRE